MIALERYVPLVRRDFPSTIPFWIVIHGLPDYRREKDSVRSIGEALGEWMAVDVTEPIPRVRVMLDCTSPLVLRQESDDEGEVVCLDFRYEKLQKHCTRCLRLTHEAPNCPEHPWEQRRESYRRREEVELRGRQRPQMDDRSKEVVPSKAPRERSVDAAAMMVSSSRRKPVRRDILPELEKTTDTVSTRDYIRKTFTSEEKRRLMETPDTSSGKIAPNLMQKQTKVMTASWFRSTVEEARIANQLHNRTEKREVVERERESKPPQQRSEQSGGYTCVY